MSGDITPVVLGTSTAAGLPGASGSGASAIRVGRFSLAGAAQVENAVPHKGEGTFNVELSTSNVQGGKWRGEGRSTSNFQLPMFKGGKW